jgi:hypothetical protein
VGEICSRGWPEVNGQPGEDRYAGLEARERDGKKRTGRGSERQKRGGSQDDLRKDANRWVPTFKSPLAARVGGLRA